VRRYEWHKAKASSGSGSCVQVMETEDNFLVRDTKQNGQGPVLVFSHEEWTFFLKRIEAGSWSDSCVAVLETEDGFLMSDPKQGDEGPVLFFTCAEWDAFLNGVFNREFALSQ